MDFKWSALIIVLIAAVIGGVVLAIDAYTYKWDTITVKSKHIDYSEHGSHYIVVTTDDRLFEVYIPVWDWDLSHNPDRVYHKLEAGKTYRIQYFGWRIENPLFYYYYCIASAEEVRG